jgi:DNA-binding NarL/FixJ family response regulator
MTIRVGIVEDDGPLRDAFARLIDASDGLTCVGAFETAEAALAALPAAAPDVVLMDINLPGMDGIEGARRLKDVAPAVTFGMLTTFDDTEKVFESLRAGATGYVLKRAPTAEIVAAVLDVCAGGAPMSGAIARKVVRVFQQDRQPRELASLTDRERQVLTALSEGQQYKEIADALGISINTVRKHIKSIYEKLHVNTRHEAVRKLGRALGA